MISQINQIQASYSVAEDRILLNITCFSEEVYPAWITRRFLKLLLPALSGIHPITGKALFDGTVTTPVSGSNSQESQIKGQVISKQGLGKNQHHALNREPLLLTKITLKELSTDQAQLCLTSESSDDIQLCFHSDLLAILLKTLEEAALIAEWNLEDEMQVEILSSSVH